MRRHPDLSATRDGRACRWSARCRGRHGWTLPEVVVVVLALGLVVMTLWLIWVNAIHQARREVVKDNLRQLGRGFATYHQTWRSFPMASSEVDDSGIPQVVYQEPDDVEESFWFERGTGEIKRGWLALLAAVSAGGVAVVTIAGVGFAVLRSQ